MGEIIYIVNHTKKQWFCPDACKWGEVLINDHVMRGILELFKDRWSMNKIEFIGGYNERLSKIRKEYKEIEIDFDDYRDY